MNKKHLTNQYQILTPDGWSNFDGIKMIQSQQEYTIHFENLFIKCTPNHKIKLQTGIFKKASELTTEDILFGNIIITSIYYKKGEKNNYYDPIQVRLNNQYFANGIVHHNCGGDCVILSTPKGCGNLFHRLWVQAQSGYNQFHPIKLNWSVHPQRDQAWYHRQFTKYGKSKFAQQYQCDFVASGNTILDGEILNKLLAQVKQPIQKRQKDCLWIFQKPIHDQQYLISADVARGDGGDFSAFHILNLRTLQQVGQYKGKIGTTQYGKLLIAISKQYNNCMVIIQNANIGWAVIQTILDLNEGKRLYYTKKDFKYIDKQVYINKKYDIKDKQRDIPGFITSKTSRPLMIDKMQNFLQTEDIQINSVRLVNQLFTFIWKGKKAQAMDKYNDDLVMSYCIGLWIRQTVLKINQISVATARKKISAFRKAGVISNGGSSFTTDQYRRQFITTDQFGNEIDFYQEMAKK